eukprot:3181459-Rhodomonas_salina.4
MGAGSGSDTQTAEAKDGGAAVDFEPHYRLFVDTSGHSVFENQGPESQKRCLLTAKKPKIKLPAEDYSYREKHTKIRAISAITCAFT